MADPDFEDLRYETDEGIATVTIDRPETHNALALSTMQELNDAVRTKELLALDGSFDEYCSEAADTVGVSPRRGTPRGGRGLPGAARPRLRPRVLTRFPGYRPTPRNLFTSVPNPIVT